MSVPAVRGTSVAAAHQQFARARASALDAANLRVATIAKLANAMVMSYPPRPAGFVRTVDGVTGAPEEAVRPNGIIVYDYQRLELVVYEALTVLRQISPVASGAYREAHTIYVNGSAVTEALPTMTAGDDVIITNLEPYARKIEVGHMKMTIPGADHVYQQAQQIVASHYAGMVDVEVAFRAAPGGDGTTLQGSFRSGRSAQARRGLQKDTRRGAQMTYPALVFSLQ